MKKKLNIAIIDDHKIIIDGLKIILNQQNDFCVIAQFYSCEEALAQLDNYNIDIFILDIELPDGNGIELINLLKQRKPNCKIIIMSLHNHEPFISNAIKNGAFAYLSKNTISDEVLTALEFVRKNKQYVSTDIDSEIDRKVNNDDKLTNLTSRELQVMTRLAKGINIKTIAYDLGVQNKTIHAHRSNIFKKLNISTMKELVKASFKSHLISFDDLIS